MGFVHYTNKLPSRRALLSGSTPAWIANSKRRKYIASVIVSTPDWVDRKDLFMLHQWSRVMTVFTGKPHVMDHCIPLNHPRVCGLTVPWNLRVVPWATNARKSDRFCEDQLCLF